MGGFENVSVSSLVKDIRWDFQPRFDNGESLNVKTIATETRDKVLEAYNAAYGKWAPEHRPYIGMLIAGYSEDGQFAEQYQINFVGDADTQPLEIWPGDSSGIAWRGQLEAVGRLLHGFTPQMEQLLHERLGVPTDQAQSAVDVLKNAAPSELLAPSMPIQDAVDLAKFLVSVAINYSRFSPGPQTVGGPIEIAVITKHEHFKWVKRKHYYSEKLNKPYDAHRRTNTISPSRQDRRSGVNSGE